MTHETEDEYYYSLRQEHLYYNSYFLSKKWYRKLFGGHWRLLKLGKHTPYIGMFCVWTTIELKHWSGHIEILDEEIYEYTGVDTKFKLLKKLLKIK